MSVPAFKRVILKISGEALAGPAGFGLDAGTLSYIADEVLAVHRLGVQVAIVVGGGNFIRGEAFSSGGNIERSVADQMGMMGTIINGLGLQSAIEAKGIPSRVQSAINVNAVSEPFIRRRALRHLEKGRVVVFVAGTGNPYFTTDSAAALRALEIGADCLLKATKVDGVYDKDPKKHADAVKFDSVTFGDAIANNLRIMDQTAFALCQENKLPVIVLDLMHQGAMAQAVQGEPVGTLITAESPQPQGNNEK
jgi:uridylate kinase